MAYYQSLILNSPVRVIVVVLLLCVALFQYADNFRLDASSDSLVLENDKALEYYQKEVTKYGSSDYLILSYSPGGDLFGDVALTDLSDLRSKIASLDEVDSVMSILDVPLMESPPVTLFELNTSPRYLMSESTDRELAKKEYIENPIYKDLLVSADLQTTALIVQLKPDKELSRLYHRRNDLRNLAKKTRLDKSQSDELKRVSKEHQIKQVAFQRRQSELIENVRSIMQQHESKASLFLGGVPMIATDSIAFIRSDLFVFGAAALLTIVLILALAFNQLVWVAVPLITCAVTGYIMVCLLGLLNWPVSVVSSNFLSLLLIITLSLNIHLVVRYRELYYMNPSNSVYELIKNTMRSKFVPCVFTTSTTIVAFGSLLVSGIRPVIDFGWMMCLGVFVALVTTFIVFPALVLISKPTVVSRGPEITKKVLAFCAKALKVKSLNVIVGFTLVSLICLYGMSLLSVENRFIDYFKSNTAISQGMHLIDEKLGGTTPLDIIIDAPVGFSSVITKAPPQEDLGSDGVDDDFDEFSEFEDVGAENLTITSHWFNQQGVAKLEKIHAALEAIPETGKVTSLASTMSAFERLKNAKPVDNIDLAMMDEVLSEQNKALLFGPYMSEDGNQIRINLRVFESRKGLDRNQLIADIEKMLTQDFELEPSQVHLSGMVVLYNNMLNSLFESQIMTLGMVFLAILAMFILLFRNIKLAFIALVPNVFTAVFVLGLMGLIGIPLDIMTITIAAISVGIAVDDSIHFVHRSREEYHEVGDYQQALHNGAMSIGRAMYYTSVVITLGFMILVFSNFVPTVYFGVLTGVAMVSALIGDLVLLPVLMRRFKPLG